MLQPYPERVDHTDQRPEDFCFWWVGDLCHDLPVNRFDMSLDQLLNTLFQLRSCLFRIRSFFRDGMFKSSNHLSSVGAGHRPCGTAHPEVGNACYDDLQPDRTHEHWNKLRYEIVGQNLCMLLVHKIEINEKRVAECQGENSLWSQQRDGEQVNDKVEIVELDAGLVKRERC